MTYQPKCLLDLLIALYEQSHVVTRHPPTMRLLDNALSIYQIQMTEMDIRGIGPLSKVCGQYYGLGNETITLFITYISRGCCSFHIQIKIPKGDLDDNILYRILQCKPEKHTNLAVVIKELEDILHIWNR